MLTLIVIFLSLFGRLVNVSDLEVFQRFRFRRDTIYFIVVEVGAKR